MLQIDFGTIYNSVERRLASGTTGVREGQALVADYENGELVVKPSNATNNEVFVGVAVSAITQIKSRTKVEVLTTGTNKKVTLAETPTASTLRIQEGTTHIGTSVSSVAGVDAAAKYNIDGKEVSLHKQNTAYTFYYRYTPTVLQVLNLQGDVDPGTAVSDVTETIGVITSGVVFTDEWITTVAWTGSSKLYTGAGGRFTTTATTGQSGLGIITKVPDTETGLLGFMFTV